MPEYLAPAVYVEETSFRSKSIEGVGTSTAAFVGLAARGPVSSGINGVTPPLLTFTDAMGADVLSPVSVVADGIKLFAKRPGAVVIAEAPGFEIYSAAFDLLPAAPAVGSVTLQLDIRPSDPALGVRRAAIVLPRDPDPTHADQPGSLFRPIEIALLSTPMAEPTGLALRCRSRYAEPTTIAASRVRWCGCARKAAGRKRTP